MRARSYLYEIPIFYLLVFAAQRAFFPDPLAFLRLNPSPYWLGVLLFGLRYGLAAGLLSGAAAAGLHAAGVHWGGEGYRFYDADFYVRPGLFMLLGAALGGVTDRFLHRIASVESRNEDLAGRNRGLVEQISAQHKAQRAIEQQVVSQMSSIVTLYHGSRDLGHLDRSALDEGILDFFTQALQATKTGLYVLDGGRWTLRGQRGWREEDAYPRSLEFTQGVVGRAGAEKRVVSLRDWFGSELEGDLAARARVDAIMAGPLQNAAGEVAAVFAVQAMPFLKFNSASVNLLTLLADWGSEALAKCDHFSELKAKSIMDEEFSVYNERYFLSRSGQEFDRCQTYSLPFSVLLARVEGLGELAVERQVILLRAVGRLLRESVRGIDIVTKSPVKDAQFGALIMTATREQAVGLRQRIMANYARLSLSQGLRVGLGSFKHGMKGVEELLEQARLDLR